MTPVVAGGWIRNREPWNYIGAGAAALISACLVFELIHSFAVREEPASVGFVLLGVVVFGAMIAVCGWWGSRMLSLGLRIDPTGVTIRGVVRTRVVPLDQVKCFEPGSLGAGGALRTAYGVKLVRQNAHALPIRALRFGGFTGKANLERARAKWQPVCDELNALLVTVR